MNPFRTAQTEVREPNDNMGDSSEADESDHDSINDEYESDAIDSEGEDDSNDVILAFIAADEEDSDERPVTTRSGRAITRRSEIDYSFFWDDMRFVKKTAFDTFVKNYLLHSKHISKIAIMLSGM